MSIPVKLAPGVELEKGSLETMFRLIVNMRRGSASGLPQAWARYVAVEDARVGAQELLRDDRVLRVMIARNTVPTSYVEWVER